jgi:integrase
MTILECIEEWKEWRYISGSAENSIYSQGKYIEKFNDHLPAHKRRIERVTPELIHAYVNQDDGKSVNTKEFARASVKALFAYAVGKGYCPTNPADIVKVNKRRLKHGQRERKEREPFTEEEFALIVNRAPFFHKISSAISWYTGLRLGDICRLEWASIGTCWQASLAGCRGRKEHIVVWTDKRDKRVSLPLDHIACGLGALIPYLDQIPKEDDEFCFPEQKAIIEDPKARARISASFGRLLKDCGIEGKSFHCLRHSFVTRLAAMGVSLKDIGAYVGHSDESTTEGYKHV